MNRKQQEKYNTLLEAIERNGGKLLSEFFVDNSTKFQFKCGYCDSEHWCTFHKTMQRNGYCPNCRYDRSMNKIRNSEEDIKNEFLEHGVRLMGEYKNSHSPLSLLCSCGDMFERVYGHVGRDGHICSECKEDIKNQEAINFMIKDIEETGCLVIDAKDFAGLLTRFDFKCSCGELDNKNYKYLMKNPYCTACTKIHAYKKPNLTNEEVLEIIEDGSDCYLLSRDYENRNSVLLIKCGCGENFNTYIDRFLYENKRQCNKCGIEKRSGENNHLWKGGITTENAKLRQSKEYRVWRDGVYTRDNFTCQCCGDNTGGNLQAHHIVSFAENLDKIFNLSNGITMCALCHDFRNYGSFHHAYEARDNDIFQLQEYFDDIRTHLGLHLITIESIIYQSIAS